MSECVLETRAVTRAYDNGRIQALRGVDLRILEGEFLSISGPSGSGKSTLMQLLGGLDEPDGGEVLYRGVRLSGTTDLDSYRGQKVGFVFQAFHLLPTLRAVENVQIPMFETKLPRRQRRERAEALLTELGLAARFHQYPNELSAGERQRVAIARSLANNPEILLADEPTGNLDTENSDNVMSILAEIQAKRAMTLIVVTHDDRIAHSAPRNIHILDGRIARER
jgi:ABC-type lipoprotein export system ATPase subunit